MQLHFQHVDFPNNSFICNKTSLRSNDVSKTVSVFWFALINIYIRGLYQFRFCFFSLKIWFCIPFVLFESFACTSSDPNIERYFKSWKTLEYCLLCIEDQPFGRAIIHINAEKKKKTINLNKIWVDFQRIEMWTQYELL